MRVLLVYSNQSREVAPAPPVGVSYVASATRDAGHEVRVLDLAFSRNLLGELADALRAFAPELVGFSIRNLDNVVLQRFESPRQELLAQVEVVRKTTVGRDGQPVPLVLGGPAVSILEGRALEVFGADYAVVGEGEEAFPQLVSALERHAPVDHIPGLCWREGGVVRRNPARRLGRFGHSGMEDWVEWGSYQSKGATWPIQTKRGCPMACSYCAYPLIEGHRGRLREPAEVADEIERVLDTMRSRGQPCPRTFEFVDSTFNIPSSHAIAICEEIIRRKIKARFTTMGFNPLDVPAELLPLMKRAGFTSVMVTPESACDAMLGNYGKGFTTAEIEVAYQRIAASGLASMWFFMLGGPGETMDSCAESICFARDRLAGRKFLSVFFTGVRVLPGTPLARQAVAEGYLQADTDLAGTVFYVSPDIDEQQVIGILNAAIKRNPGIVHAAEGGITFPEKVLNRVLHTLWVAPPYWRFLPAMLAFPPLHFLRCHSLSQPAGRGDKCGGRAPCYPLAP